MSVHVGDAECQSVLVISSTQITCTLPHHPAGNATVKVHIDVCTMRFQKLASFVPILPKDWSFLTISYPNSAVQCSFVISHPYSALAEL